MDIETYGLSGEKPAVQVDIFGTVDDLLAADDGLSLTTSSLPKRSSSYEDLKAATDEFVAMVIQNGQHTSKLKTDFPLSVQIANDYASNIQKMMSVINSIEQPLRDSNLVEFTLANVVVAMAGTKDRNAQIISVLYSQLRTDKTSGTFAPQLHKNIMYVSRFFSFNQLNSKLPNEKAYINHALNQSIKGQDQLDTLGKRLLDIKNEINAFEAELNDINKKIEAASQGGSEVDSLLEKYSIVESRQQVKIKEQDKLCLEIFSIAAKVQGLLDVTKINEVYAALKLKAHPTAEVINNLAQLHESLTEVLRAVLADPSSRPNEVQFNFPFISNGKKSIIATIILNSKEMEALSNSKEKLSSLVSTLNNVRACLSETFTALSGISETAAKKQLVETIRSCRLQPLVDSIFKTNNSSLSELLLGFVNSPAIVPEQQEFNLAEDDNSEMFKNIISRYIFSTSEEEARRYFQLIENNVAIAKQVATAVSEVRQLVSGKDYTSLAVKLDDHIDSIKNVQEQKTKVVGMVLILSGLVSDFNIASKLRQRVTKLSSLNKMQKEIVTKSTVLRELLSSSMRNITRKIDVTMRDYISGKELKQIRQYIKTIKYLKKHPELLEGYAGHEIITSGILLIGRPGIGKSFFLECMRKELELPEYNISPENAMGPDSTKKINSVIDSAIECAKRGEFCVLSIDEVDSLIVKRGKTSSDQARLTVEFLVKIEKIRRDHPQIILLMTANYEGLIDRALKRDGRADYIVRLNNLQPSVRANMIRATISKHGIGFDPSREQMKELVKITKGFMPTSIKQPLIYLNRVVRHKVEKSGRKFELTFDMLMKQYQETKVRLEMNKTAKRRKKGD